MCRGPIPKEMHTETGFAFMRMSTTTATADAAALEHISACLRIHGILQELERAEQTAARRASPARLQK
jgi:hypothetical protein